MLAPVPRSRQAAIQETRNRARAREAERVAFEAQQEQERKVRPIPANCRRVLNTPLPPNHGRGYCEAPLEGCPGIQRDGGCLAQLVMAAEAQGVEWSFETNVDPADPTGQHVWWDPLFKLEPFEPRLPPNVPPELVRDPEPTHFEFHCPHCGNDEVLPLGFYWCSACGKNANDP